MHEKGEESFKDCVIALLAGVKHPVNKDVRSESKDIALTVHGQVLHLGYCAFHITLGITSDYIS